MVLFSFSFIFQGKRWVPPGFAAKGGGLAARACAAHRKAIEVLHAAAVRLIEEEGAVQQCLSTDTSLRLHVQKALQHLFAEDMRHVKLDLYISKISRYRIEDLRGEAV